MASARYTSLMVDIIIHEESGVCECSVDFSKKGIMNDIATVLAIVAGIILLGAASWLIPTGINRNEVVQCNQWKSQAATYQAFYLLKWQKEQCDAQGITIIAPVK